MATLWITALAKDQAIVQALARQLKPYGLDVAGHFWIDDLDKFAWMDVASEMTKARASAWLVLPSDAELAKPSVRYGLNALATVVNARVGRVMPLAWWGAPADDAVPALLRGAVRVTEATPSWQAKLVALAHRTAKGDAMPYRIGLHADPQYGQWFEVGPMTGTWDGVMLGVEGAAIDFHAVGPRGALPQKSVLEYAQKDMRIALGAREFTAWACRNTLDADTSYFVRVGGAPESLLFGPLAQDDDADAFVLSMR